VERGRCYHVLLLRSVRGWCTHSHAGETGATHERAEKAASAKFAYCQTSTLWSGAGEGRGGHKGESNSETQRDLHNDFKLNIPKKKNPSRFGKKMID
jgi:hypothetical protein